VLKSEGRRRRAATFGAAVIFFVAGCGSSAATSAPQASTTPLPTAAATPSPVPTPTVVPTPAPTAAAGLFVDAGSDQGPISSLVFGTNTGPWLPVPFALQSTIAAAKLTTLTFPGGNWGDENDVTTDQVDAFIAYCRQIGAEPRIVTRLKGGTAQQAADLVKYVNVTMKYGVKYWAIGNEPDLYSAGNVPDYNVDLYNTQWREWAKAMKAVDPSIQLIGPDISQFVADTAGNSYMQTRTDWLTSFLKANGDMVSIVSIHRYPFPADGQTPPTIADLRSNSQEWDQIIPALRAIIKTTTGKDLPVAVTEINSSWAVNAGGEATMDSHYNAIWFADVLGRMIHQKVFMVDQFALAGQYGIVDAAAPRPMYYAYMMYQRFGSELVRAQSDDPNVTVYAARRADGTLTVMIVNLGDAAATSPLTIVGGGTATSAATWLFDKDHPALSVAATALTGKITVPAQSVTLLEIGK
jgi:Glycosyl hydrolases family 39